jgi:hypothetical protein
MKNKYGKNTPKVRNASQQYVKRTFPVCFLQQLLHNSTALYFQNHSFHTDDKEEEEDSDCYLMDK